MTEPRRLYRDTERAMVGGVAAGLAAYLNADVTVMRVVTVLLIIFTFSGGLIAYLAMWLLIPPKPAVAPAPPAATPAPPAQTGEPRQ